MSESKTGKQIVDDFFKSLTESNNLDQRVVNLITSLHDDGKLTNNAIDNGLAEIRKELLNETE